MWPAQLCICMIGIVNHMLQLRESTSSLIIFCVKRQFINETLFGLANLYFEYLCFMCFIPGVFQQFDKMELIYPSLKFWPPLVIYV
jgi:hypothetical protein